ncbi:nicotinate-nucleotide adenylyltransferase [Spongiivirga citrea]|uniref:Nicotinate-nucleotide adenylyltransferase n=1 Tax=Spongiivirga citrea TaxID=1481457 RepID=A0A6M0CJX2_9FLAO|nr:nicotinate-nucleotide adenylyltransferase [Spongiivirga citrea]NER15727.1 nicotinate-nucleotide adenylyltransferase [Spongiivirga citrea]
MKRIIITVLAFVFVGNAYSQIVKEEKLAEVVVTAVNYKYVNQVGTKDAALPVKMLERKVANFDLKNSDIYNDEYDYYTVSFYIPDGKIVAAYDKDGKIIRTIERFKDINLPQEVRKALVKRFPGWEVEKDVYKVTYGEKKGAKKTYKIKLKNGDKKLRVKSDAEGNFL